MERFKKIYEQGFVEVMEIWVDTETGINYLFLRSGNAAGKPSSDSVTDCCPPEKSLPEKSG